MDESDWSRHRVDSSQDELQGGSSCCRPYPLRNIELPQSLQSIRDKIFIQGWVDVVPPFGEASRLIYDVQLMTTTSRFLLLADTGSQNIPHATLVRMRAAETRTQILGVKDLASRCSPAVRHAAQLPPRRIPTRSPHLPASLGNGSQGPFWPGPVSFLHGRALRLPVGDRQTPCTAKPPGTSRTPRISDQGRFAPPRFSARRLAIICPTLLGPVGLRGCQGSLSRVHGAAGASARDS